jgi:hypothetical protein
LRWVRFWHLCRYIAALARQRLDVLFTIEPFTVQNA